VSWAQRITSTHASERYIGAIRIFQAGYFLLCFLLLFIISQQHQQLEEAAAAAEEEGGGGGEGGGGRGKKATVWRYLSTCGTLFSL